MDINDERQCETIKIKNRRNATSIDSVKTQQLTDKLSTIEKVDLANKYIQTSYGHCHTALD